VEKGVATSNKKGGRTTGKEFGKEAYSCGLHGLGSKEILFLVGSGESATVNVGGGRVELEKEKKRKFKNKNSKHTGGTPERGFIKGGKRGDIGSYWGGKPDFKLSPERTEL